MEGKALQTLNEVLKETEELVRGKDHLQEMLRLIQSSNNPDNCVGIKFDPSFAATWHCNNKQLNEHLLRVAIGWIEARLTRYQEILVRADAVVAGALKELDYRPSEVKSDEEA